MALEVQCIADMKIGIKMFSSPPLSDDMHVRLLSIHLMAFATSCAHRNYGTIELGRTAARCASCTATEKEIELIWTDGRTLGDTLRSYTLQRQEDYLVW